MKNNLFRKIYTIIFFLFYFGFLIFAAYICLRDQNYGMLLYSGLFWIVGIIFAKKRLFNRKPRISKQSILPFRIVISVLLVIIAMLIGIGLLIQGVLEKEFVLIFIGGFFLFGAFAFVLGALTIKGCFDKCKIDVLGLYAGLFFVLFGSGFVVMTFQQNAGVWILIPIIMVLAGVVQIVKCLKKK